MNTGSGTTVTCRSELTYREALTRGRTYSVVERDCTKEQVRIVGDNGRARWFPWHCFVEGEVELASLESFRIRDRLGTVSVVQVDLCFSSGERRWCNFATPESLSGIGDELEPGGPRFLHGNRHLVIVDHLTEPVIGRVLRYIDGQGDLPDCSLPVDSLR